MSTEPVTESPITDSVTSSSQPLVVHERVQFALRQAGLVGLALLVTGLATDRLRPEIVPDRGIATTTFWWAIIIWTATLLFNAIAFERSQMEILEDEPMIIAAAIAIFVLLTGLVQVGASALIYLLAAALGTAMFWWGLLGLAYLIVQRISER